MAFDLNWLSNPEVFQVGTLPPHSDHDVFADAAEAERGVSTLIRSLDGVWKAHFALNPAEAPDDLLASGEGDAALRDITVPGDFSCKTRSGIRRTM